MSTVNSLRIGRGMDKAKSGGPWAELLLGVRHIGIIEVDGSPNTDHNILSLATVKTPKCGPISSLTCVLFPTISFICIFEDMPGAWGRLGCRFGSEPCQAEKTESKKKLPVNRGNSYMCIWKRGHRSNATRSVHVGLSPARTKEAQGGD